MATPTELYINAELPKRPYTAQYPLTAGHVPVATGVGLEVAARQLDVTDVANAASETYVDDAINALVDGAPAALDTLNELAAAINDDASYAATVTTALGNRLRVDVNTQGLTNTEKQNGLDNLGITEVITDASVDASGLITFTKNTGQTADTVQIPTALNDLTFNSTTGVLTLKHTNSVADSAITITSNEIADDVFRVKDNVDGTKKIAFEASGLSTGATRTITMPNTNVDLGQIPYIQLIDQSITYDFGNVPSDAKYTKYVISAYCVPKINLAAFTSRLRQIEVFNASNDIVSLMLQDSRTISYSSGGTIDYGVIYIQPGMSISIGIGKSGFGSNGILVSESTDAVALLTPAVGGTTGPAQYAKLRFIEANGNFSIGAYTLGGIGYTIIAAKANSTITLNNELGSVSYLNLLTNAAESPLVLSKGEIAYIFPNNSFIRIAEKNRFYTSVFRLKESGSDFFGSPPYADNTVGFAFGFDWLFNQGVNRTITIPNKNIDLSNIGRVPGYTNPTAYVTGDVVAYNGQEFRCRATHTSSTAEPDYTKFTPVSGTLHIANASASVTPPINPEIKSVEISSSTSFTLNNTDVTTYPVKIISTGNSITVIGSPTALTRDGVAQNITLGYSESATVTNGNRWTTGQNEFTDNVFRVKDNVDGTKKIAFEASGISTATTRTITMPNKNIDLGLIGTVPNHADATVYAVGQVVSYNGQEFRCRIAHTSTDVVPDYTKFSPVSGTLYLGGSAIVTPPVNPEIRALEVRSQSDFILENTDITAYPVRIISIGNGITVSGSPTALVTAGITQNIKLGYAESAIVTNGNKWTIASNDVADNIFRIKDHTTPTKKIAFDASGISAATTRTITMPDANVSLGQMMNTISVLTPFSTYTVPAQGYSVDPAQRFHYICYVNFNLDATAMQAGVLWATNPTSATVFMNLVGGATYQDDTGAAITQVVLNAGDSVYLTHDGTIITARRYNSSSSSTFRIYDSATPSKRVSWNVSGISSSTTRTVTMPNANVNLGDLPTIANFNSNITSNNGTILSRNSTSSSANGVVLLSGDGLSASFNYSTPGAVVVQTGKGAYTWTRPAVCETVLTDFVSGSLTSNALTIGGGGTANQPYACAPAGSTFWALGGGLDTAAVHTLTFCCSVYGGGGFDGIFSGQRRITVRRRNATDTYTIVNTQTIGTDDASAGITGITVTVTLNSDRLNIVISCTAAGGSSMLTSASLTSLITSLG